MIPMKGSSFGRAGGPLRRYPGGTENASIFATVRGSIPNRRAASRRLIPSTYTARRTCPYSSTPFIPPPSAQLFKQQFFFPDFSFSPPASPARPPCPSSSPPFTPPPSPHLGRSPSHAGLLPRRRRSTRPLH